jgi:hypothetical protein
VAFGIQVASPIPGATLSGIRVRLTDSRGFTADSVFAGNGVTTVSVPANADTVTVEVFGNSVHFPSYVRVARSQWFGAQIRVVLLPRNWIVRRGAFAGSTVPVSPYDLLAPPVAFFEIYNAPYIQWWPGYQFNVVIESAVLPVPLCFDRANSTAPITTADSIVVWQAIAVFHASVGIEFFRPANAGCVANPFDSRSSQSAFGLALNGQFASSVGGAGVAFTMWAADNVAYPYGNVEAGTVFLTKFPSSLQDSVAVKILHHELLHLTGAGHTCRWVSLMVGYPCPASTPASRTLTVTDVAIVDLLYAMRDAQKAIGAPFHWCEAWNGLRVIERNLAPAVNIPYADGSNPGFFCFGNGVPNDST